MIKDAEFWRRWEDEYKKSTPVDFEANLKIMEDMMAHALALGIPPRRHPLENIKIKIKIAKAINAI